MRWRACLLVVVMACGDNLMPAGPVLQRSDQLIIVAHQDDDLLFMQPDLAELLASRVPLTTVYVTAGDGGNGLSQALARMADIRAAYGLVLDSQAWSCGWLTLEGQPASLCQLADRDVSIITLGLPDGGVSATAPGALIHLFEGTIDEDETIAERPGHYTRDRLIAALADIIRETSPTTIRTLDMANTHGGDHPDHTMVGTLAMLGRTAADSTASLMFYRGYNTPSEPATIPDAMADAASLPMRAYEACWLGCGVCGRDVCPTLTDPRYAQFVRRRYASATRGGPLTGKLRSGTRCVVLADDETAMFGNCDDAPQVTIDPDGVIHVGDRCLELEETGAVIGADCTPAPAREFVLDDEGHLWAGTPADALHVTLAMHATCLTAVEDALEGVPCGADADPRLHIERPIITTPHTALGFTASGRSVRLADFTGDGRADLCTVTGAGLVCAPGDGTGTFTRGMPAGTAAALRIAPDSLAIGDIDGDGAPDVCGTSAAGVMCATTRSGLHARPLPASCVAQSLGITDDVLCASDAAGLTCATLDAATPALESNWPRSRALWLGDLDADGTPDWCVATDTGPACGLASDRAATTAGLPWGYSLAGAVEGSPLVDGSVSDAARALGDVTGDGRADLCELIGQRVMCAPSEGRGFGPRAEWMELPDSAEPLALWLGDLDGDGKADPCVDTPDAVMCVLSP